MLAVLPYNAHYALSNDTSPSQNGLFIFSVNTVCPNEQDKQLQTNDFYISCAVNCTSGPKEDINNQTSFILDR